jgi:hypothetical protein
VFVHNVCVSSSDTATTVAVFFINQSKKYEDKRDKKNERLSGHLGPNDIGLYCSGGCNSHYNANLNLVLVDINRKGTQLSAFFLHMITNSIS